MPRKKISFSPGLYISSGKNPPCGFTLIELMTAVSILSIGIVLILRSYLSVVSALDSSQSRIDANVFLESKMNALSEELLRSQKMEKNSDSDTVVINGKDAQWSMDISDLEEDPESKTDLSDIKLKVSWEEGNREKGATLETYVQRQEDGE